MKKKEQATVLAQEVIADRIYSMWLAVPYAKETRPGQFVSVYCIEGSRLLPRPISVCEVDEQQGRIRLVYRVAGAGTNEFAGCRVGDHLATIGPLGNGFPMEQTNGVTTLLLGGGIGIPPMVETAKRCQGTCVIGAGFQSETFLTEELEAQGELLIATEDGSTGTKGNVLDALKASAVKPDLIFVCGPTPMLRAVKEYAAGEQIPCYLSVEERMACGIGACLACVCRTREVDAHSQVHNRRVCKDGPVFEASEVEL